MFDSALALSTLKWASIALGAASALWGLLARKPTQEDELGRKRLTPAGLVTVGIILCTMLISAMSFCVEILVRQEQQRVAEKQKDEERRVLEQKEKDARSAQAIRDARAATTEAEARATRSEQQAIAAQELVRDVALSGQVVKGAEANLARTSVALTQLERLLQPLEPLTVDVEWEIPGSTPGLAEATRRVGALICERERDWRQRGAPTRDQYYVEFLRGSVNLEADDEVYPNMGRGPERPLAAILEKARLEVLFLAVREDDNTVVRRLQNYVPEGDIGMRGDISRPAVSYDWRSGSVRFHTTVEAKPADYQRTGVILSIPDLERALLAFTVSGADGSSKLMIEQARPVEISIRTPTRAYARFAPDTRKLGVASHRAVYALDPLGAPGETAPPSTDRPMIERNPACAP